MFCLRNLTKKFLVVVILLFLNSINVYAINISHKGTSLSGTESNFTFAKSIWTNTDSEQDSFNGNNSVNYLLIDDIYLSGSLQIISPISQSGAQISLYKLVSSNNSYSSTLVKTWSGEHLIGRYYISEPGEYLIEAHFPGEDYPHISIDFYPDNTTGACINLAPIASGLTCNESWLPSHYRKEVEPWIRGQINEIKHRLGLVNTAKEIADYSNFLADSAIDAAFAYSSPGPVIGKKAGQLAGVALEQAGHGEIGFAVDQAIQHGIVISQLFISGANPLDPGFTSAWLGVVQQLSTDAASIRNNAIGIYAVDVLKEKFNELHIAWVMLETLIEHNYGHWDSLAIIAGLDPADNPDMYQIIDGVAQNLGYKNTFFITDYNPESVNALFNEGAMDFGDWVFARKILSNPLGDVDGDGIKNKDDSHPNDSLLPVPVVEIIDDEPHKPIAKISASATNVSVNTLVTLDGSSSYDPDGDSITGTHSWILTSPNSSSSILSDSSNELVNFTPDVEGTYTVQLTVNDGQLSHSKKTQIIVTDVYPNVELVYHNDGEAHIYISDLTVGNCTEKIIGSYTVPQGERWKKIKFAASQGDLLLVARKNSWPTLRSGYCGAWDYRGEQHDYYAQGAIYDWGGGELFPGDTLYLIATSYAGITGFSINTEVTVSFDVDKDGVPDGEEDVACLNNINESFDSDGDGICNNQDKFDNDPAASVDTDMDGFPNSWNTGKNQNDSTTGLILDHPAFVNNSAEWADNDNDGIGDNADNFDNDLAASLDTDGDGYPDSWNTGKSAVDSSTGLSLDKFPNDPAASMDSDGDNYPDQWNPGKTVSDSTTGLILDRFPNEISEWADSDFDGVGDNSDWAPNDYTEWADSDIDGVGDNADAAPNDPLRSTNEAPVITQIDNQQFNPGEQLSIGVQVTDQDNDTVNLSLLHAPSFVSLNNQFINIAPALQDKGDFSVILRASDNFGGITHMLFTIRVIAVGNIKDFNGDGSPDLLLRNYNHGKNQLWYLDGASKIGQISLPTIPDINWTFEGMADFNGDGNPDLLLRNHNHGANQIWFMEGANKIGQSNLPTIPDTSWTFEGAADFNGDNQPDLILRNHTHGKNLIWYMDGASKIGQASLPTIPDTNWYFEGVADFDGDNKADLLLRNHSHGKNQIWYMDGVSKIGSASLPTIPDTFWVFQGGADFNADNAPDLLMRNYLHGANQIWYMNGASKTGQVGLPTIPDVNWRIENR